MIGPILYFRGCDAEQWHLVALIVLPETQSPPSLVTATGVTTPETLATRIQKTVWRYRFTVPRKGADGLDYTLDTRSYRIYPPSDNDLRIAFTACNGSESDVPGDDWSGRNERWAHLMREHIRQPFQLLLQGGDQLYADSVWRRVQALADWRRRGRPWDWEPPGGTLEAIRDYYFELYCWLWAQADLAPVLASIPSLMMWDDHDIFDGWGSHVPRRQNSPVFRAVGSIAREHFRLFQLAMAEGEATPGGDADPTHFGWAFELGEYGVICPDLRSERSQRQVMGEAGWRWFESALQRLAACKHVLLLSTVPLINIDLSPIERIVAPLPSDHLMQDDLRDQWRSYKHRSEWQRMVQCLLDFSERNTARVTVLSGEIHLAAHGRIRRGAVQIEQLVSSGIVHPPPPTLYARTLHWFAPQDLRVCDDARLSMFCLPGRDRRYLTARNWLSLDCAADGSVQASWHAEDRSSAMPLAISAMSPAQAGE